MPKSFSAPAKRSAARVWVKAIQALTPGDVGAAFWGQALDEGSPITRIGDDLVVVPGVEEEIALRVHDNEETDGHRDLRIRRPRLERALGNGEAA